MGGSSSSCILPTIIRYLGCRGQWIPTLGLIGKDMYCTLVSLFMTLFCVRRFDGRSLLDYIPGPYTKQEFTTKQDKDIQDELNFERYHDLVEMERLQGK